MTAIRSTVAAAIAAALTVACGSHHPTAHPAPRAQAQEASPRAQAIRDATVDLSAVESCLNGVRDDLPFDSDPAGIDAAALTSVVDAANQRLLSCRSAELLQYDATVGSLRTAAPWTIAHAATLAQADAHQAAGALQILIGGFTEMANSAGPGSAVSTVGRADEEFHGALDRIGRWQQVLDVALARTEARL